MNWTWLAELPSTNVRILATICLAIATGVKVIGWEWEPPIEWLGFLTLWAGLDVGQFWIKRKTYQNGSAGEV